ncbi:MAG: hypothetical protein ACE5KM_00490 [Planctomycetaceae bacterium]
MPNELPIPDDLHHLIEKRSGDDRRHGGADGSAPARQGRRANPDRRGAASLFRAGEIAQQSGRYRCETCRAITECVESGNAIPPCRNCGNHAALAWLETADTTSDS